jgi:hypothetical protein
VEKAAITVAVCTGNTIDTDRVVEEAWEERWLVDDSIVRPLSQVFRGIRI